MELYLVRHAQARPKTEDPQQGLSEGGREQANASARFLSSLNVQHIYHSGKKRAEQTAEIFARELGTSNLSMAEGLNPNDEPSLWSDRLWDSTENTMLVGHLPWLSRFAGLLLFGNSTAEVIEFAPASVMCLIRHEGKWYLKWFVSPEMLR